MKKMTEHNDFSSLATSMMFIGISAFVMKEMNKMMFGEKGLEIKDVMAGIIRGIVEEVTVQLEIKNDEIKRLNDRVKDTEQQKIVLQEKINLLEQKIKLYEEKKK